MSAILLVDHDLPALAVLGALLGRSSDRIVFASSARDAVDIARQIQLDCVLTATNLPDGTGEALQERFRDEPSLRHVRFFFMTGCRSDVTDLTRARGFVGPLPSMSLVHLLFRNGKQACDPTWIFALHRTPRN